MFDLTSVVIVAAQNKRWQRSLKQVFTGVSVEEILIEEPVA